MFRTLASVFVFLSVSGCGFIIDLDPQPMMSTGRPSPMDAAIDPDGAVSTTSLPEDAETLAPSDAGTSIALTPDAQQPDVGRFPCERDAECFEHETVCIGTFGCRDGFCLYGLRECEDLNPDDCLAFECVASVGCVEREIRGFCDDGLSCTTGRCRPNADGHDERGCIQVPNDDRCSVQTNTTCAEYLCVGEEARAWDPGSTTGCAPRVRYLDACDPQEHCILQPNGIGVCEPLPSTCESGCDDGDPCNGREFCSLAFGRCVSDRLACGPDGTTRRPACLIDPVSEVRSCGLMLMPDYANSL